MGKTRSRSRIGVGVWRFCRIRSGVEVRFLLICWSQSLVSNYKIETKNDTRVKCDFDVTIGFPNFEDVGVEYNIRKIFGVGVEFVGVGVESESEIRDSAPLWS